MNPLDPQWKIEEERLLCQGPDLPSPPDRLRSIIRYSIDRPIIDLYYDSLLRNKNFSVGLHSVEYNPVESPPKMVEFGRALALAYQVEKSYEQ